MPPTNKRRTKVAGTLNIKVAYRSGRGLIFLDKLLMINVAAVDKMAKKSEYQTHMGI